MLEASKRNRGTIIALVLLAAGVAGTVLDPNGPIGVALFGVAAAAAVYLSARPFRNAVRRLAGAGPKSIRRRTVVSVVRGRTVAVVTAATAVLFASWMSFADQRAPDVRLLVGEAGHGRQNRRPKPTVLPVFAA